MRNLLKVWHERFAIRCPKCNEELFWRCNVGPFDYLECKACDIYYQFNTKEKGKHLIENNEQKESLEAIWIRFPGTKSNGVRTSEFYKLTLFRRFSTWLKLRKIKKVEK